jgi:uncharacterized protein YeaC (DUF1315 family)
MRHIRRFVLPALVAAAAVLPTLSALAQGPGGGGGGGFQMTPEMRARMEQMRKWRDSHKNVIQVQQTMGTLVEIDKDPKTKLTKDQAKKILAVVNTWKAKPVMTDDQAKGVNKQLTGVLNLTQIKKMAQIQAEQRNRRGGWGGGGGGGGRGPRWRGGRRPGGSWRSRRRSRPGWRRRWWPAPRRRRWARVPDAR